MPALVMRFPAGSLLSRTYELIVRRQIQYGVERRVPWGVSESAYNARDLDLTYQYSSFGVPGLGLKRGLSEDIVIAPYAAALAAMITAAATQDFALLAEAGGKGTYGFYEALDYTGTREPEGKDVAIVRAYMSHHQGMSLVAIANVLNDGVMEEPFPRRADRQGHRAPAPGTYTPRRAGRATTRGRSLCRGASPRPHSTDVAAIHLSA